MLNHLGPTALRVVDEEATLMLRDYYAGKMDLVAFHDKWNRLSDRHNALIASIKSQGGRQQPAAPQPQPPPLQPRPVPPPVQQQQPTEDGDW